MENVTSKKALEDLLLKNRVVVVDFWAKWCGPCKALAPVLAQLDTEYGDRLTIATVDVDENEELCGTLNVTNVPTLLFFVDGKQVEKVVGTRPKTDIAVVIDGLL